MIGSETTNGGRAHLTLVRRSFHALKTQLWSAFVGSTRIALRAGTTLAASATTPSTAGTATKVNGSRVPTPNTRLASKRLATPASAKPTKIPKINHKATKISKGTKNFLRVLRDLRVFVVQVLRALARSS